MVQRNETEKEVSELEPLAWEVTPVQLRALEALLSGASSAAAAEAAGVDRSTLWRWQRTDFEFRAALNRGRAELQQSSQLRLEALASSALSAVGDAIEQGNVGAALAVLRGLGMLSGERPAVGSSRPATLEREHAEDVARELRSDGFASKDFALVYGLEEAARKIRA